MSDNLLDSLSNPGVKNIPAGIPLPGTDIDKGVALDEIRSLLVGIQVEAPQVLTGRARFQQQALKCPISASILT